MYLDISSRKRYKGVQDEKGPKTDLGHAGMIAVPVEQWHWGSEGGRWEEPDLLKDLMTWTWTNETCDDMTDEWVNQSHKYCLPQRALYSAHLWHTLSWDPWCWSRNTKKKQPLREKEEAIDDYNVSVFIIIRDRSQSIRGRCSHW